MKQGTLLTRIVMAILFVAILVYIAAVAINNALNPIKTVTALAAASDDSKQVKAWIFREETTLPPATGLVNLRLDEGDKIAMGKTLAMVYQSQEALGRQQELREINSQKEQLTYAISDAALDGNALESDLNSQISQLRMAAATGDYGTLAEQSDTYKKLILRREFVYAKEDDGTKAALTQAAANLTQEQTALQNSANGEYSEIISPAAGYYSAHVDGMETLYLPAVLEDVTTSKFIDITQQTAITPDPATLGKIVTSARWKLAFLVSSDEVGLYRTGSTVQVGLSANTNKVDMKVEHISLPEKEQCVVVLVANENLKSVLSLRNVTCSVIFDSKEGILIPKEALRVLEKEELPKVYSKKDRLAGIFAVTGYQAEFKPVKVLAETDNGYIVEASPQYEKDERILRSGDEVILAATDLYDGKVVK